MAVIPAMPNPNTTYVQTGNLQVLVSWNYVAGATSYSVQRSTDGITFSTLATPSTNFYLDTTVTAGTLYYYQVASTSSAGTSGYTTPQGVVPTVAGQLSLGAIRLAAQQRADRVNSNFVTLPEWNFFINQAAFELYDILVGRFEDMFVAQPAYFTTDGSTYQYPLPNGILNSFKNQAGQAFVPQPFYKLLGIDLGINSAQNGFTTVKRFNFINRNKYVFPNQSSTIYGVNQLEYRLLGSNIEFIPIPAAGQTLRLWYIPRMPQLLMDTDVLDGVSGWIQYVIVRAAKYALDKEESSTDKLDQELAYLKKRIEESAQNRDVGQAETIADTRNATGMFGLPGGFGGGPW